MCHVSCTIKLRRDGRAATKASNGSMLAPTLAGGGGGKVDPDADLDKVAAVAGFLDDESGNRVSMASPKSPESSSVAAAAGLDVGAAAVCVGAVVTMASEGGNVLPDEDGVMVRPPSVGKNPSAPPVDALRCCFRRAYCSLVLNVRSKPTCEK